DADQLARDLLAAFVADGQHHRVFPCTAVGGVAKAAFHAQWHGRWRRGRAGRLTEAQLVAAGGTHDRTFQDGLPAVRTGARRPSRARVRVAHEAVPSCPWFLRALPSFASSQPNSAWPRMREPAATLSDPAFRSPVSAPLCSSSTCTADSMLPTSSPPIVTFSARTLPVTLAPGSMVRSPRTLTSPLKLPAMRTWPAPSILPSIVMSGAISDSALGLAATAARAGRGAGCAGCTGA